MKYKLIIILVLITKIAFCQLKESDTVFRYNNYLKKYVISKGNIFSYFDKNGKLILQYDYNNDLILKDSINRNAEFFRGEMDSFTLKRNYDIPPSFMFVKCCQGFNFNVEYPAEAQEKNIEGDVILKLHIDKYGNVLKYEVMKTIGYGVENTCIKSLKPYEKCWFPAIKNGKIIPSETEFTFHFSLNY